MKSKIDILQEVLKRENRITQLVENNPYENGTPIQSDYFQVLAKLRASVDALIWVLDDNIEEDANMKNTKVISGFPAVGKSYLHIGYRNVDVPIVLDSDSSDFSWIEEGVRHPDFPNNYMKHIKENIGKADIILVSSHDNVRQALKDNGIHYTLVYPDISLKDKYIDRYKKRGNNEGFISFIDSNWEAFINDMDKESFPAKVKLAEDEFLSDVLDKIIL